MVGLIDDSLHYSQCLLHSLHVFNEFVCSSRATEGEVRAGMKAELLGAIPRERIR